MVAAYCVRAHVPSEHIYEQMIYYTRHRCKVSLQYVHADVTSDSTDAWIIYYIYHMYKEALQYALMYFQISLFPEWFITDITQMWTLSSM